MVADEACVTFLKWCLPRLGLRWSGYRKVRRLVGKRLGRRLAELGLADLDAYSTLLLREPGEWTRLDAICRIPISRFYRDRAIFDAIGQRLLPEGAEAAIGRGDNAVRCWSAGCASGEEPYTLVLLWRFVVAPDRPKLGFTLVATDIDETMLNRAQRACYARSSLKDVPAEWVARAFARCGALLCLLPEFRREVQFMRQDIRTVMPDGPFGLILCRNLVFTYFDEAMQRRLLVEITDRLMPRGFLVLGAHEVLPLQTSGLIPIARSVPIYRREN
jgi:chemotaxis protein methyltransferase CheR